MKMVNVNKFVTCTQRDGNNQIQVVNCNLTISAHTVCNIKLISVRQNNYFITQGNHIGYMFRL